MKRLVSRFLADESGATSVEYVLLAGLIAVAIIGGATLLGTNLNAKYNDVASKLN